MAAEEIYVDDDQEELPPDPERMIGGFEDRWLICRDIGHSWKPGALHKTAEHIYFRRELACRNCKTVRTDVYSLWGSRVGSPTYRYPDGYQLSGLRDWGVSRDDFRREVMKRAGFTEVPRLPHYEDGNGQVD
jgi:hypothetical protein